MNKQRRRNAQTKGKKRWGTAWWLTFWLTFWRLLGVKSGEIDGQRNE